MTVSVIIVAVIVAFFTFLTIAILEMERSYKANILGGLIVMWSVILIFLLVAFFAGGNSKVAQPAKADQMNTH